MKKPNYKEILLGLCVVFLLLVSYNQYKDKKMYEAHISNIFNQNTQIMVTSIVDSHSIYMDILISEEITHRQIIQLSKYSRNILMVHQQNRQLAMEFNRLEPRMNTNEVGESATKIDIFYSNLIGDERVGPEELDNTLFELDHSLREKIEYLQDLNSAWLEVVQNNIIGVSSNGGKFTFDVHEYQNHYGKNSISNNFWVELLVDMNTKTTDFLSKHNIYNVGELL
jgi:hypothetical protein